MLYNVSSNTSLFKTRFNFQIAEEFNFDNQVNKLFQTAKTFLHKI